nr:PREDICTED: olfactory receptor 11A1-like [Equus przewalskii]
MGTPPTFQKSLPGMVLLLMPSQDCQRRKQSSGDSENQTTWLILVGFRELQHLGFLPFIFFLAIYVVTVGGNVLIALAVASSRTLHTPMYFFLCHFSLLEIGYTSNIVPQLLWSFLEGREAISLVSCLVQFYMFASLAATECLLLSAMSYDRYLAICHPLHYPALMSTCLCGCLAAGAWFSGFSFSAFTLTLADPLPLCPGSREIDRYFCDFAPVTGLFCGDVAAMWGAGVSISGFLTVVPFLLIVASYAFILRTVPQIPSGHGREKAFSTCSSHLSVVGVFYGTLIVVCVAPTDHMPPLLRKAFSVFYTVFTPMVNPIIYSLKNQQVNGALHRLWGKLIPRHTPPREMGQLLTSSWIPA